MRPDAHPWTAVACPAIRGVSPVLLGILLLLAAAVVGVGSAATPTQGTQHTPAESSHTATHTATNTSETADSNATNVSILAGSATPNTVSAGTTVSSQHITVYASGVSADGARDTLYIALPDTLAANVSIRDATALENGTVASTAFVDGSDDDNVTDTVAIETNATGGGTTSLAVRATVSIRYPPTATTYAVDAQMTDSTGSNATKSDIASITATESDTSRTDESTASQRPTITDFQLNATDQDVDVVISSTEDLEKLKVKVKGKTKNVTLTRGDFSETTRPPRGDPRFVYNQDVDVFLNNTSTGDVGKLKVKVKSKVKKVVLEGGVAMNRSDRRYVYRADVSNARDGTFSAQLLQAASGGRNATVGQRDELTVDTFPDERVLVFLGGLSIGAVGVGLVVLVRQWRTSR